MRTVTRARSKDSNRRAGSDLALDVEAVAQKLAQGSADGPGSGAMGRNTLAMHVAASDAFGVMSSGWQPLFEVSGDTGHVYARGNLGIGTTPGAMRLTVTGVDTQNTNTLHAANNLTLRGSDRLNLMRFGGDGDYQLLHKGSGAMGRNTLAMHVAASDAFGVMSSGWKPVFEVLGDSGNTYARGNFGIGTTPGKMRLSVTGNDDVWTNTVHVAPNLAIRGSRRLNLMRFGSDGDYQLLHEQSGALGRSSLGLHVHASDAFGVYSSGWRSLFEVAGGTGNVYARGNVGIGITDARAKLSVKGPVIRRVAIATGLGPDENIDNGQLKSRVLSITKLYDDTAIRIVYCDNLRVYGNNNAGRWEIRIDGKAPPGGAIRQDKYSNVEGASRANQHEPATIVGYALGVKAGNHQVQVWVANRPHSSHNPADVHTGWPGSRWTLEAEEVWT